MTTHRFFAIEFEWTEEYHQNGTYIHDSSIHFCTQKAKNATPTIQHHFPQYIFLDFCIDNKSISLTNLKEMLIHLWKVSKYVFTFLWKMVKCCREQKQLNMVAYKEDGTTEEEQMTKEMDQYEDGMIEGEQIGVSKTVCMSDDVWFDVFDFLERLQLARTVSLTNWHIHQICWPRLHGKKVATHDVNEITIKRRDKYECHRCQPPTALLLKDGKEMPWPDCSPPAYISRFKYIKIKFLDQQVLEFLTLIMSCLTTNAVRLRIHFLMKMSNLDEMQHDLVNQFLQICRDKLPTKMRSSFYLSDVQHFVDMDNQMQLITLQFKGEANIPILIHFLASSRADRQQRVIYIHLSEEEEHLAQKILDAIKQEFRDSTQPLPQPFAITLFHNNLNILDRSEEENHQVTETLTIKHNHLWSNRWYTDIYRYPKGQFEQWEKDRWRWGRMWHDGDKTELEVNIDACDDSVCCWHNIFCLVKAVGKWLNWLNTLKLYVCA